MHDRSLGLIPASAATRAFQPSPVLFFELIRRAYLERKDSSLSMIPIPQRPSPLAVNLLELPPPPPSHPPHAPQTPASPLSDDLADELREETSQMRRYRRPGAAAWL